MKQGRTDRDWAVVAVMAFAAGALLAWALLSKHPPQPRPPISIDWPAWVQAVGSVGAILAAIGIAAHERSVARAEEAKKDDLEMKSRHTRANRALERFQKVIADQLDFARTQQTGNVHPEIHPLPLPDEVKDVERDCYLMGEAGGDFLTVTNSFLEAQSLIKGDILLKKHERAFIEHLQNAQNMSNQALKKIREPLWRK
ncbi:hypothetical protein [Stenotrophomonas maltophilia]|uniref:hypothetical protein n=1 Tax=Stenotrophomonas maltophilia TaxID=40324 RepID=UPI0018624925|nr:hypothetical protein [Stenotrophomonas maltophilia]QNG72883.1 hypothetical protein EIELFIGP_01692 [Stenotrophomonas maltophilia]